MGKVAGLASGRHARSRAVIRLLVVLLLAALPQAALAQQAAFARRSPAASFAIESLGGTADSGLGFIVVLAIAHDDPCGEDLTCARARPR
jgi:hypothetical protein